PVGVAVSIGVLDSIATSFVPALEKQISTTRAADYYQTLLELTDRSRIAVGLIDTRTVSDSQTSIPGENQANTFGDQVSTLGGLTEDSNPLNMIAGVLGRLTGSSELQASLTVTPESQKDLQITDSSQSTTAPGDSYLFWIIAPSPDNQMAIVEFAVEDTATFVYATDGDYDGFVLRLNMALEAIAYKREAIWLSDDELHKPQNADYYMAAKRTAALKFVRSKLVTRIIHSSVANWRQKLLDIRHV
ncbi:MAG: hypothetical protein LBU61_04435, partial [Coriobacteriales bacterium]|nr:hypothetical protein [Coriobacteriales bacterium]